MIPMTIARTITITILIMLIIVLIMIIITPPPALTNSKRVSDTRIVAYLGLGMPFKGSKPESGPNERTSETEQANPKQNKTNKLAKKQTNSKIETLDRETLDREIFHRQTHGHPQGSP